MIISWGADSDRLDRLEETARNFVILVQEMHRVNARLDHAERELKEAREVIRWMDEKSRDSWTASNRLSLADKARYDAVIKSARGGRTSPGSADRQREAHGMSPRPGAEERRRGPYISDHLAEMLGDN
jgi:hypothetical protein